LLGEKLSTAKSRLNKLLMKQAQALFGGMWLWQPNDNTWELVTLNIGRKM
jgi:hypothetical protein